MNNRSNFNVMTRLIVLVKPLFPVMFIAILTGCLGYFCASFLTVLGGYTLLEIFLNNNNANILFFIIFSIAVLRGILHYIEQYCNHFIAFKLLAIIRDKVFTSLRKLAPAKLDSKDKGNLISVITSDIELLEVFYAHTISPIFIAIITSSVVIIFISSFNIILGIIALIAHLTVGIIIPLIASKSSKNSAKIYREETGNLNTYFLDSLRGMKEVLQYDYSNKRKINIQKLTENMNNSNKKIKEDSAKTFSATSFFILMFSSLLFFTSTYLYLENILTITEVLIPSLMLFSSFGAVTSVANLGSGLANTIASGNRVLDLLDETPLIEEISDGADIKFNSANIEKIDFAYNNEDILKDFSLDINKNEILGITGKSGTGKSTILKLLMRFWDIQKGKILISNTDIKEINTSSLRDNQSFVTQETHLFNDTIKENIRIANLNATDDEIENAAKKASIHDFITTLPNGYDTKAGELGDMLSGGERQRIGVARAFLHNSPLILLDEPTSNLDSLIEGVILNSLKETKDKTIILVSHRESTMKIANRVFNLESTRYS